MTAIRVAAIFGFLAVALGAFGAHGLKELLAQNHGTDNWHTAVLYHLVHAVVLLCVASQLSASGGAETSPVFWLFAVGIVLFSGSLYLLALTPVKWIWPVTPLGGLCLLAGWLLIAIKGFR